MAMNRINRTEHTHAAVGGVAAVFVIEQPNISGIPISPDIRSDSASETRMMLPHVRKLSFLCIKAITTPLKTMISTQTTIKGPCTVQENLPSQGTLYILLSSVLLKAGFSFEKLWFWANVPPTFLSLSLKSILSSRTAARFPYVCKSIAHVDKASFDGLEFVCVRSNWIISSQHSQNIRCEFWCRSAVWNNVFTWCVMCCFYVLL